jgi:hypothetical protein
MRMPVLAVIGVGSPGVHPPKDDGAKGMCPK